jgi:hypothetical protein
MTATEIIVTIFSSSVLSASLTGIITWRLKQNEFRKTVFVNFINRRLEAYKDLENLLGTLSLVIRDDDGKKYHFLFSRVESFQLFIYNLGIALKFNTWYSSEIIETLREINILQEEIGGLMFDNEDCINENIKIGKRNYERICILKDELLEQIRKDYSCIHVADFKRFYGKTTH